MSNKIKNFTIIAHVDHGKSTLADSILMLCGNIKPHEYQNKDQKQILDNMDLERERGITIKAQTVRLVWKNCVFNLIDTPGHADFQYEVSRSLICCETALLVIDATQGIEAQTLSNFYKALDAGIKYIIPVINKIDLPTAQIDRCLEEINDLGLDLNLVHLVSAKTGEGVSKLLDTIANKAPEANQSKFANPKGSEILSKSELDECELRVLVMDSWYDRYFGVVTLIRVFSGIIKQGDSVKICSTDKILNVLNLGIFLPEHKTVQTLCSGELGFLITQVKNPSEILVGDTIIHAKSNVKPLDGFKKPNNVVFCTFYPEDPSECSEILESLKKYQLNDSAFDFIAESSELYGMAFHCGFLGLLHMEVVKERLEREYEVFLIASLPCVSYKITYKHKQEVVTEIVRNVEKWPQNIIEEQEPEVLITIMVDNENVGKITTLCINRRAIDLNIEIKNRVIITCKIPLGEIIVDFDDKLKSSTRGFCSFEYEIIGYRKTKLSKLFVLINDEVLKEFGLICHVDRSKTIANNLCTKLKNLIPRGQTKIKIQIARDTESNVIAREDISPFRKDVIAKCYGGDITRKKKLLEKQKKGKKIRSEHYNVVSSIPNNVLKQLLTIDD